MLEGDKEQMIAGFQTFNGNRRKNICVVVDITFFPLYKLQYAQKNRRNSHQQVGTREFWFITVSSGEFPW